MKEWNEIFGKFAPMTFGIAFSVLKDREEAEDVVQDVFTEKVRRRLQESPLESEEDWGRWLVTVTRNLSIDRYRRNSRSVSLTEMEPFIASEENENESEDKELRVSRLMESLEPRYRQVLTLKYLWNLTWQDVAARMGLSTQGARKRASTGMKKLRLYQEEMKGQ